MLLRSSASRGMRGSAALTLTVSPAISSDLPDIRARSPPWNPVGILAQEE